MAKAGLIPLILGAGSAVASGIETRKTRKAGEATVAQAEEEATAAAQATKDEAAAAETESAEKRRKRAAELATGGRAAQFRTGPLGLTSQAAVARKTLLGA